MNRKRCIIVKTAIVFSLFLVFLRLVDLMVFNHKLLYERALKQYLKSESLNVRRGIIYDRKGRELAINLELDSFNCNPTEIQVNEQDIDELSRIIGKKPEVLMTKFNKNGKFVWIERKLEPEKAELIKRLNIKGCNFSSEAKRFYPKEQLASHVIGFVGIDNQPLGGIELKYDKYLKATGGKIIYERDASGKTLSSGVEREVIGNSIVLTIDEALQYIAEKELDKAVDYWRASAGSIIIMNPFNGEILALANRPTFDPNKGNIVDDDLKRNRAITDIYEPGSTFKLVIGVGALEEKIVKPDTLFDVSKGSITVGGKTIRDVHRNGVLTFKEVIQKSSNVGSIMTGMKLGKERIYKYARLLGFGQKTGIDLPGEVSGWIHPPENWSNTSLGAVPIGQEVAVTPLQMLRAYSAIANGGYLVKPHIVSGIISPRGEILYSFKDTIENKRIISERTSNLLKNILKSVTEEGGTGKGASVFGNSVAGKTGTAQMIDPKTKRYSKEKYVSSFVGFVPADDPRLAIIVVIYEPKGQIYGGVVAAPVFKEVAEQALSYLGVPIEEEELQKHVSMKIR